MPFLSIGAKNVIQSKAESMKNIVFYGQSFRHSFWRVSCFPLAMRKFCHLLFLGAILACGTMVASAAPGHSRPSISSHLRSTDIQANLKSQKQPFIALTGANFGRRNAMDMDFQVHLIRFVDRYWPAKSGFEPPPRISAIC